MKTLHLEQGLKPIKKRDPKYLETDISAVRAIAQAAINVELFTIPLYMVSLYSIKGTHPINSKDFDYYKGRVWPGSATTANPKCANQKAFNIVFSVFVDEMLHLQMASNIAKIIRVQPKFTSSLLQNDQHGWTCYGENKTVIPHIINLIDTTNYKNVKVKLDSLNKEHLQLFLAVEQPLEDAKKQILPDKIKNYFPEVPFENWTPDKTETDLPMFGSIGWLYECYASYLSIEYSDGTTLWNEVSDLKGFLNKDMFNHVNTGHPKKEFPNLKPALKPGDKGVQMFNDVIDMMSAITDQGEGNTLNNSFKLNRWKKTQPEQQLAEVEQKYRPSEEALKADYPSYTDTGKLAESADKSPESADAKARFHSSPQSHYERFEEVLKLLNDVITWDSWHTDPKNIWTAEMLTTSDYNPKTAPQNIPTPEEVAGALNRLKNDPNGKGKNHEQISRAAVGAIAGITTILDNYWQDPSQDFPYPSMVGSGDRVSIGWAIFGKAPDLSLCIGKQDPSKLYNACQGLALDSKDTNEAAIEVFHSCRGSNVCKAQGGCGFAQLDSGGGSCSAMRVAKPTVLKGGQNLCGSPTPTPEPKKREYSAPSDNKCKGFGGCAVPISASQLYPDYGGTATMKLYDFVGESHQSNPMGSILFKKGESVYEKAWEAYSRVMKHRGQKPGEKPQPSDLRIALPPST